MLYSSSESNFALTLNNEAWFMQYSPYVYYDKHAIVINETHSNMSINDTTFSKLLEFVDKYPTFFIGRNADLRIVDGSILNHEHYQGGGYLLPVFYSKDKKVYLQNDKVKVSVVDWYNNYSESANSMVATINTIIRQLHIFSEKPDMIAKNLNYFKSSDKWYYIGLPIAIIGLILSVVGGKQLRADGQSAGLATAGLVLGIIAVIITALRKKKPRRFLPSRRLLTRSARTLKSTISGIPRPAKGPAIASGMRVT